MTAITFFIGLVIVATPVLVIIGLRTKMFNKLWMKIVLTITSGLLLFTLFGLSFRVDKLETKKDFYESKSDTYEDILVEYENCVKSIGSTKCSPILMEFINNTKPYFYY